MIGLTLLATAIFTLGAAILCAVAMQDAAMMPATVNPFGPARTGDPSADTMRMSAASAETLNGDSWHTNEVRNLREAEDVLDWLENHNVRHSEMTNFNGKFQVRWR